MAVYTHLDLTQTQAWLARNYPALPPLRSMEGISEGVENSNFLLRLQDDSLRILTLYEKRVRPDELPYFLGLMAHLHARGCATPQPVPRGDGALFGFIEARPGTRRAAAVVTFLPGANMAALTAAHLYRLGQGIARMHAAGRDFAPERANDLSPLNLEPLLPFAAPWLADLDPALPDEIARELASLPSMLAADLPRGQVHADLFRDNVFFSGDDLTGFIDFYFACTDWLVYDLAVASISWCMENEDHRLAPELHAALLEGYASARPLTPAERHALPWLMRGAALRFMLTRAHDWLHRVPDAQVVVKDPGEYLAKWRSLTQHDFRGKGCA